MDSTTATIERAFRFVISDIGSADTGLTLANTGNLDFVYGDECVRQAILLLIRTRPGERVMRPDYGCKLSRLIFAPNDETTAGLAIHYVREAIEVWEPRARIVTVDAAAVENKPDVLEISLQYRVVATQSVESLNLQVDLSGDIV